MAQYAAITTTGGDWWIDNIGPVRDDVETTARQRITANPTWFQDIYAETEMKNLRVMSVTAAKRFLGAARWRWLFEQYLTGGEEAGHGE